MAEDAEEDVGEEADEVEEDTDKEVMEEATYHMKMGLAYQMSPVFSEDTECAKLLNKTWKGITEDPVHTKFLANKRGVPPAP